MHYWQKCRICNFDYDVIGRVENFQDDTAFILQEVIRCNSLLSFIFKLFFQAKMKQEINLHAHDSSGGSTYEVAKFYFSRIPQKRVRQLYELYKTDFELFGYIPHPFLNDWFDNVNHTLPKT